MNWIIQTITSSLGKKLIMALSGTFLIVFLIGHLAGNLQLLIPDKTTAQLQFNEYALFMSTNPGVQILAWVTKIAIIIHFAFAIALNRLNKAARPVGYAYKGDTNNASWASKNMVMLGVIILAFTIIHLKGFWFEMHYGAIGVDANGNKDLYTVVDVAFQQWWYVALYVVSMVALGIHLAHGFGSSFQTLGANHRKYTPVIAGTGKAFSVVVAFLFAIIPVVMYLM